MVVAIALVSTQAAAQPHDGVRRGAETCRLWVTERGIAGGRSTPGEIWMLKFLSDVGPVGTDQSLDPLYGDAKAIWAWTDNYCRDHPTKDLADSGVAFYQEHPRRPTE
jgi:hypothetical protein